MNILAKVKLTNQLVRIMSYINIGVSIVAICSDNVGNIVHYDISELRIIDPKLNI